MNQNTRIKVPPNLILTAWLSSSLTSVWSLTYGILSFIAIVYRYQCDVGSPDLVPGSGYFMNTVLRLYIQEDSCNNALSIDDVTTSGTVFLLVILTFIASVLTFIAAICVIITLSDEKGVTYLKIVMYSYIGINFASLIIDITVASHFGMDYSHISEIMDSSTANMNFNYANDMARLGALLLMTISLKGYAALFINIVLLVLLIIYLAQYQAALLNNDHSIHKLGALNAFEQPRRLQQDPWQSQSDTFTAYQRGVHVNSAFIGEEDIPRTPIHDPSMSDYSNRMFDRSESWHAQPTAGSRPFSYLEEPKQMRSTAPRPPPPPAEPQWRSRDNWPPPPPVPAPDYSPPAGRRLKSALKPAYM